MRLWPDRATFLPVVSLQVLASVLQGIMFVLLVPVLRALLRTNPDVDAATRWVVIGLGVVILAGTCEIAARNAGRRTAGRLMMYLQHALGKHIARLPLGWFTGNSVGRLARDVAQSAPTASSIASLVAPQIITAVVTPLTVAVFAAFVDWQMAVAFVCVVPLALLLLKVTAPVIRVTQERMHAAGAEAGGRAVEYAKAQAVLRSTGRVQSGYDSLERTLDEQRSAYRSTLSRLIIPEVGYVALVQTGFAAVFVLGVHRSLGGQLGVAEVIGLLVLATRFIEPLALVANLFGATRQADVALGHIEAVLGEPPLPETTSPRTPAGADIEFDHVSFGYGAKAVLRDVSFSVPAGTTTAIVGPSGSGKTTAMRLVSRFWDVDDGAVRVGGVDVREIGTGELMGAIANVFQDVYLFDASILENVRLARPDATDAEIEAAGRAARLDEVVERLPDGWQTRVGEGGSMLSGGERQRVSIARALLKDAPIILLDEATAALDAENETRIHEALSEVVNRRDRTVIVIAHRLSTVTAADQIVFLDGGRVVEQGNHHGLLAQGGRYAGFWNERSQAKAWRIRAGATNH